MNTIDYVANGQNIQFSKKTVTIDGEEFAYTGMSAIKHSSTKHIYLFKYDGQWQILSYNEADEQKLKTLFTRIADLNAKRAATPAQAAVKAEPGIAKTAGMPELRTVQPAEGEEIPVSVDTPEAAAWDQTDFSGYAPAAAAAAAPDSGYSVESAVAAAIGDTAEGTAERTEAIPQDEKKAKMKKALIIFAAVIALFVILGVVYFFVAGTSNNPTVGPNADETQQYEDIDGLIEDLQEE